MHRSRQKEFVWAIVIALILHVVMIPLIGHFSSHPPGALKSKRRQMHVRFVPPPANMPKKQLVTTPKPLLQKKPDKADRVSEFDQKVDRETVGFVTGPHDLVTERAKPKTLAQQREQAPSLFKGSKKVPNLLPSWREMQMAEGMPFNDHIENVEQDAATRLNTFEWKHATFFNRIKENVSRAWNPLLQIRRYDPQATLIGHRDRLTVLTASIDKTGNLVDVRVKDESGVYYLDEEAIHAFQIGAPFPHPPKELFAQNERFSFTFGFYVSYEKGISLDFDWSR